MWQTIRGTPFALLASLLLTPIAASAETAPKVTDLGGGTAQSVLFVGNSYFYYNNGIHHQLSGLVAAADPQGGKKFKTVSITISGGGLSWHDVGSYFRPDGVSSYSIVDDREIRLNDPEKRFDVVVMADCSRCPIHPKLTGVFHEAVRRHSETVRLHGAKPVLMMTWANANKPEMTTPLAEQYTLAGNENQALVVPAGLAFAKARARRPSIILQQNDNSHPTLSGTYLAACTLYAALYGKSPVGSSFTGAVQPRTQGLDPDTARFLQEVAWETVREYFGAAKPNG